MATIGTVNVRITGDISGLVSQLKAAGLQVQGFDKKVKSIGGNVAGINAQARGFSNLARAFTNAAGTTGVLNSEISILASSVGNVGLLASGAGIGIGVLAAGLGASIASAIGFETAITKVAKTANFSKEETKAFGDEILAMSRRLPVATADLTRIAEVAGQLGIQGTTNIAKFVEEIAKLSSTTGVASDVLATGLGTLVQVAGLPIDAIDNISASLTHLGNTSNSTETQILDFATRLVGIGTALKVPVADILSIGSSFAAAGVPAERGGTAIQNILIAIAQASDEGGDALTLFADVAGLTVDEFQKLQATDPGIAFTKVVEGFGKITNVLPVLEALELANDRIVASALAAGFGVNGLTVPLLANRDAAIKAAATNDEFGRSSATTGAKIQVLKNNIGASATELGTRFLPAIKLAVDGLNGLFGALGDIERVGDVIQVVAGFIPGIGTAIQLLTGPWASAWDSIESVAVTAINTIISALEDMIQGLGGAVTELRGFLEDVPGANAVLGSLGLSADNAKALSNFTLGRVGGGFSPSGGAGGGLFDNQITFGSGGGGPAPDRTPTIPGGLLPSSGGGGGALTALEAAMDGIITRSEALTLGLTDQEVITLELAVAQNRVADEEFRRRIGLQALAQAYPGLTGEEVKMRLGLEAIAAHLALTGESIEKFILDTSTAALEGFQSAFDAIFNKPTKEDSGLQLQLLEAQRRKLLAGDGASDAQKKAFDAEIQNLQNLIAIRRNADDIFKTRADIADNTALTDAAQATAAELYIAAIATSSAEVEKNAGLVFLQTLATIGLKDQTLSLTTAFANLNDSVSNATAPSAPAVGSDWQEAFDILHNAGIPGYAQGTSFVPRDMVARIHRGEAIIPASENRGESGAPINVTSYITIEGDATERTVEMIKKAVREEAETAIRRATFRGSYVTSGAYTPS